MYDHFTIVVPYVADPKIATEYHPTDPTFAPLTRGTFESYDNAIFWATFRLGQLSYENHWYVQERTFCRRCGKRKDWPRQSYCGELCALAESEARQLNLKGI